MEKALRSTDLDGGLSLEESTPLSWGPQLESLPQGSGPAEPAGMLGMTSS